MTGGNGVGASEGGFQRAPAELTKAPELTPEAKAAKAEGEMNALRAEARATGDLVEKVTEVASGAAKEPAEVKEEEAPEAMEALAGVTQEPLWSPQALADTEAGTPGEVSGEGAPQEAPATLGQSATEEHAGALEEAGASESPAESVLASPGEVTPAEGEAVPPVGAEPPPTTDEAVPSVTLEPQPAPKPPEAAATNQGVVPPPPIKPVEAVTPQDVASRIAKTTNSDNSENPALKQRKADYDKAQQTISALEAKGALSDEDNKTLDEARKTRDAIQRDVQADLSRDQIAQSSLSDSEKKAKYEEIDNAQVAARLTGDEKYQKAKQLVDAHPELAEHAGKDIADVPKELRKNFEEYEVARRQKMAAEHEAGMNERERHIRTDPSLSVEDRKQYLKQLETFRRETRRDDLLQENKKYSSLHKRTQSVEDYLRDELKLSEEDLKTLGRTGDIAAFAGNEEKYNKLAQYRQAHGKEFNSYLVDRAQMNELESLADIRAAHERYDKGIDDSGEPMTGDAKEKKKKISAAKAKKSKDFDPAKGLLWPRRTWYNLNKKINWAFGKEMRRQQGKKFTDNVKLLAGTYGLRGFIPFGIGSNKDDRDQIRRMQWEAVKGLYGWTWRSGMRLGILAFFVSLGVIAVSPVVAGKALDMTKPFGGNA